jgi:hypothetical protein
MLDLTVPVPAEVQLLDIKRQSAKDRYKQRQKV